MDEARPSKRASSARQVPHTGPKVRNAFLPVDYYQQWKRKKVFASLTSST